MSELLISSEGLVATVNTTGAWVTDLSLSSNNDTNTKILFPRQEVQIFNNEHKLRGGMHICSPYFGPSNTEGGQQHGFSRGATWAIDRLEKGLAVLENTHRGKGPYHNLSQVLTYSIWPSEEDGYLWEFSSALNLRGSLNLVGSTMEVSPGFHPYFLPYEHSDELGTTTPKILSNPEDKGADFTLKNGIRIRITTTNIGQIVTWSDNPDLYSCVEPIHGKNSLLNKEQLIIAMSIHIGT